MRPVSGPPNGSAMPVEPRAAQSPRVNDIAARLADLENAEALYVGDSVLERVSRDDTQALPLSEIVRQKLAPGLAVGAISGTGYHPGVFVALLKAAASRLGRAKIWIVPVNLRCFSPQWDMNPMWQHQEEIDCLSGVVSSAAGIDAETYESIRVSCPQSPFTTVGDFQRCIAKKSATESERDFRAKQIFIFHYLHSLDAGHRKLEALREIEGLAEKTGIKLVMYCTPINHRGGQKHLGRDFIRIVEANVKTLIHALSPFGERMRFDDLSRFLDSSHFFHADNATEHLNQNGRKKLALRISESVRKALDA